MCIRDRCEPGIFYHNIVILDFVCTHGIKFSDRKDLQMYCLRHTYCTDLQSAGVPINVARELMGHSSIALTAQIYTHMTGDVFSAAAEKIAAFGATASATLLPDKPPIFPVEASGAKDLNSANKVCKFM